MYKFNFLLSCLLFSISLTAQLYTNASNNLPANGAQGQSMDVQAADIDGDDDLDIILANEFQANTILINDGNANFTNETTGNLPQENHDSEDVAIADFNDDGFLDLVFCSEDDVNLGIVNVHEYYLGNGLGTFAIADFQLPDSESNAVIHADLNGDTFADLLFGNKGATSVLINSGNGSFALENNRVPQLNKTTQDLAMADIDNDGDLDLFEGNENGNALFINDGNGFFSDETASRLPQGLNLETRKVSFGDIDGDQDLDIFLSNVEFIPGKDRQNRLFLNDGNGVFSDITESNLPADNDHTIDAIFEDVDFDNDLDIIVCNVFGGPIRLYQNDGNGKFEDQTLQVFGQFFQRDALGVIARDFNGDGLNDLYICDRKTQNSNNKDLLLLRNMLSAQDDQISSQQAFDFTLSPNPVSTKEKLNIQFNRFIPDSLTINNISGKILQHLKLPGDLPNASLSVEIADYAPGTYLIIAHFKDRPQISKKLVIE